MVNEVLNDYIKGNRWKILLAEIKTIKIVTRYKRHSRIVDFEKCVCQDIVICVPVIRYNHIKDVAQTLAFPHLNSKSFRG